MTLIQEINRAIAAHSYWRHYLRVTVAARQSRLSVETVRSADACEFGGCLKALPPAKQFGELPKRVHALHAEFHEAAAKTLAAALDGRSEEALDALSLGGEFAQAMAQLLGALRYWKLDEEIAEREAKISIGAGNAADAGDGPLADRPRRA